MTTEPSQSYAEKVGFALPIDWILDEFDASFNALAIASMRLHMDHPIYPCPDERRARFEALIERLGEPRPTFTEDELAILHPPGWKWEDDFEPLPGGGSRMRESTPERQAVYDAQSERDDAHFARIQQARKDFIDVLPHLWS